MERSQKARTEAAAARRPSAFVQRAVSTLLLGPLALYLIYLGGWFYFLPLVFVIALATIEYSKMLANLGWRLPVAILLPAVLLQLAAAQWPQLALTAPAMALSLLVISLYALWRFEQNDGGTISAEWAAMVAGVLILGWMGGHFFSLRGVAQNGAAWTALAMVTTWVADSAAYLFGTRFGRRKLAPRLSPHKTQEGYFSGIVVGTIIAVTLAYFLELPLSVALIMALLLTIVSTGGDLAISLLKREAGVKDSGRMLPGHGGALDRIDSLLWSVTIAYYVVVLLS